MIQDDDILNYLEDDGIKIEPNIYYPIIPMVLINGVEGIGTGYSTYLPSFNPKDIISWLYNKMENKSLPKLVPWFKNFTGEIKKIDKLNYLSIGKYQIEKDKLIMRLRLLH